MTLSTFQGLHLDLSAPENWPREPARSFGSVLLELQVVVKTGPL